MQQHSDTIDFATLSKQLGILYRYFKLAPRDAMLQSGTTVYQKFMLSPSDDSCHISFIVNFQSAYEICTSFYFDVSTETCKGFSAKDIFFEFGPDNSVTEFSAEGFKTYPITGDCTAFHVLKLSFLNELVGLIADKCASRT